MKNILIAFIFVASVFNCFGQVAIELEKVNVLYPVVKNPLTIVFESVPDSNLLLVPSRGEIKKLYKGKFIWQICKRDTQVVFLQIFDKKVDTLLRKTAFQLLKLPSPTLVIGERAKNKASTMNGVYCYKGGAAVIFKDFPFDLKAYTVGFDVTYFAKGQDPVTKSNPGARYSSGIRSLMRRARPGDKYIFHDIAYRIPCEPRTLYVDHDIVFTIK